MPNELLRLNLALQGGGSHGAFTWGVLDALLEDDHLDFEGISGTSAGAMNAVALAQGFAQAAQEYTDPQEARLAGAALARTTLTRLWEGVGALGGLSWGAPLSQAFPALQMMTQWLAPAQANPLDINPLRRLLERVAGYDEPVIFLGEPGTGKEFFARRLHEKLAARAGNRPPQFRPHPALHVHAGQRIGPETAAVGAEIGGKIDDRACGRMLM